MSLRQSGAQKVTNFVNAINGLISSHNSSSTAHSTEMAKKVNINQGTTNNGKFLKVSSGNVTCESVTIPSASSSTPSADVSGGAIGSSSNYAKADHQHPLSSAYATSEHNHDGTYLKSVTAHTSTTGSDFGQATGAVFGHIKLSNNYTSSAGSATSGIGASSQAVYNVYNEFSNSSKTTKNGHTHDYAPSSHNQDLSTINNVSTVAVVVTYTDNTSETLNLVKYTGS